MKEKPCHASLVTFHIPTYTQKTNLSLSCGYLLIIYKHPNTALCKALLALAFSPSKVSLSIWKIYIFSRHILKAIFSVQTLVTGPTKSSSFLCTYSHRILQYLLVLHCISFCAPTLFHEPVKNLPFIWGCVCSKFYVLYIL